MKTIHPIKDRKRAKKIALAMCLKKITDMMAIGIANQTRAAELLRLAFDCCELEMSDELQASCEAAERGERITLSFESIDELIAP